MLMKRLWTAVLVLGIVGITRGALAQSNTDPQKSPDSRSLLDRFDDFTGRLFGAHTASDKTTSKDAKPSPTDPVPPSRTATIAPSQVNEPPRANASRAGSILTGTSPSAGDKFMANDSDFTPDNTPPAIPRSADGTLKAARRPVADRLLLDDGDQAQFSADTPGTPALYERLAAARLSVFPDDPQPEPAVTLNSQAGSAPDTTAAKSEESKEPKVVARPIASQRAKPAGRSDEAVSGEPALAAPAVTKAEPDGPLFTRKGPQLSVETTGPRRIAIGKESTYEVRIVNSGEVAAEDLVVFVTLPESAEVAGSQPSAGSVESSTAEKPTGAMQWKLSRLEPKGQERLLLKIVPHESRPFDLAVRWESKPVASQAMIEVQEPKLLLQLEGPREVLYGKKDTFRLKLTNTGNGAAENVAILLMPMGTGENVPASHKIGTLAAGTEKVLDVELTARQMGNLTIQVEARGDGVHAQLSESVLVRRAGLKVDVDGPKSAVRRRRSDVCGSRPQHGHGPGAKPELLDHPAGRRQVRLGNRGRPSGRHGDQG